MITKEKVAQAYVSLMVHIAKSDGILDDNESQFIYKSTKGYLKRFGVTIEADKVGEIVRNPTAIEDCLISLQPLEHKQKLSVVMQLVIFSYAYDGLSKEEHMLLKTVVEGMFQESAAIIHRYIDAKITLYTVEKEMHHIFPSEGL